LTAAVSEALKKSDKKKPSLEDRVSELERKFGILHNRFWKDVF